MTMSRYEYREESGHTETLKASSMEEALKLAKELCRDGEWGDEGAAVSVWVAEYDEDGEQTDFEGITVEIEPNHKALIRRAGGDPDCDHDWTSEGEGGSDQNPGVWKTTGDRLIICKHCRTCGLHRTERVCGKQRDPGECDRVEYRQPEKWCADCESESCECETDDDE